MPRLRHERHGVADRRERIAQLVREHRDELVHALRRVGQRLGMSALRQVLRDTCTKPRVLALRVVQGA